MDVHFFCDVRQNAALRLLALGKRPPAVSLGVPGIPALQQPVTLRYTARKQLNQAADVLGKTSDF